MITNLDSKLKNLVVFFCVFFIFIFGLFLIQDEDLILIWVLVAILGLIMTLIVPVSSVYFLLIGELAFVGGVDQVTVGKVMVFFLLFWVLLLTVIQSRKRENLIVEKVWYLPLVIFLGYCLSNLLPAFYYRIGITSWFRELFPLMNYALILSCFVLIRNSDEYNALMKFTSIVMFLLLTRDFLFVIQGANGIAIGYSVSSFLSRMFPINGSPIYSILALLIFLTSFAQKDSIHLRLLFLMPAIMGSYILLYSGTRTYWIGLIICLFFWLIISVQSTSLSKKRIALFVFISIILLSSQSVFLSQANILVGGQTLRDRISTLSITEISTDWSYLGRSYEAIAAVDEIKKHPLIGYGLGYNLTSYARFWTGIEVTRGFLHNFYLYIILKLGIIGLLVFCLFLWRLGLRLWEIHRKSNIPTIPTSLLSAIIFLAAISFATSKFNDTLTTLLLSILVGSAFYRFNSLEGIHVQD